MDPTTVTIIISLLDNLDSIGGLLRQLAQGQQPTPEQLASAKVRTDELMAQLHALLPPEA